VRKECGQAISPRLATSMQIEFALNAIPWRANCQPNGLLAQLALFF